MFGKKNESMVSLGAAFVIFGYNEMFFFFLELWIIKFVFWFLGFLNYVY